MFVFLEQLNQNQPFSVSRALILNDTDGEHQHDSDSEMFASELFTKSCCWKLLKNDISRLLYGSSCTVYKLGVYLPLFKNKFYDNNPQKNPQIYNNDNNNNKHICIAP